MNEMELLRKLAVAAKRERVPTVDVSRKMAALLSTPPEEWDSSLAWLGGLSLAAALPAVIMAFMCSMRGWIRCRSCFSTWEA